MVPEKKNIKSIHQTIKNSPVFARLASEEESFRKQRVGLPCIIEVQCSRLAGVLFTLNRAASLWLWEMAYEFITKGWCLDEKQMSCKKICFSLSTIGEHVNYMKDKA